MKNISITLLLLFVATFTFAQIDKEQLSLDVSKAEAANTEALKAFIWKRHSTATVDGVEKATVINELSFDENGEIQMTQISGETSVKQKPGLRGKAQANAAEESMDYVEKALQLALAYTYMSKGQMMDFFDKAVISENGDIIEATANDVYLTGDKLTIQFNKETKLFIKKTFSSLLDADPINGEINYALFTSGINHGTTTVLNLSAKNAVISAKNQDYTQRVM